MRIGYEAKKAVKNFTGIGNYSRRIINCVANNYTMDDVYLFYSAKTNPMAMEQLESMHHVRPKGILSLHVFAELWRCFFSHNDIKRLGIDVYHGLSNEIPFDIRKAGCKTVVTIHDLIFLRCPETYSWTARLILRTKTKFSCRVADAIVAVSQKTKDDLMELYHVPEEKIHVIYQGCHEVFYKKQGREELAKVREKYNLPDHYLLNVGTVQFRKNQKCAISALKGLGKLSGSNEDMHLVIVGNKTEYQAELEQLAEKEGVRDRVHFHSGVYDSDLAGIYQLADIFVYPSIYEGFGIPLAEAMNSNIPVIASRGSCLEEVAGPDSLYCDPNDVEEWTRTIQRLMDDKALAEQICRKNAEYVKRFQWGHIADELHRLYESL